MELRREENICCRTSIPTCRDHTFTLVTTYLPPLFFKTSHKRSWKPSHRLGLMALLLLLLGGSFWYGMERGIILAREYGFARPTPYFTEVLAQRLRISRNAFAIDPNRHPTLDIQLSHRAAQRLAFRRAQALKQGFLIQEEDDWVKAELQYGAQSYPARLRLKGDMLDHLRGEKWSFRIKLKGDHALLGMQVFSVQHPRTRAYLDNWLFQQACQAVGLPALRMRLLPLRLNGAELGWYLLEEGFDKRLLEHNRLREGPILRFDEDAFWRERQQYLFRPLAGQGDYLSAPPDAFRQGRLSGDSSLLEQARRGAALLEGFRQGRLSTGEVFDTQAMARYVALADLFGVAHALHSNQLRFYADPLSLRLSPIPFDADAIEALQKPSCALDASDDSYWTGGGRVRFLQELFKDKAFFRQYLQQLERFAEPSFLDSLQSRMDPQLDSLLALLQTEFPKADFSWRELLQNQQHLGNWLSPSPALRARLLKREPQQLRLEVANRQAMPIEVTELLAGDSLTFPLPQAIWLEGRKSGRPPLFQSVFIPFSHELPDSLLSSLQLGYRLPGLKQHFQQIIEALTPLADFELPKANFKEFEGIKWVEVKKEIYFEPGNWQYDRPLRIPAGWQVFVPPACNIELQNGAYLWIESPVRALGEAERPIRISSTDSSGQGLMLLSQEESWFRHVIFHKLAPPQPPGAGITGAVSVQGGKVRMQACVFSHSSSEDALNLVKTDFLLQDCRVLQSSSDGLDVDFSQGKIRDCRFLHSGNDGVDISGSYVEMEGVEMGHCGDKGLSVGEDSRVKGEDLNIHHCQLGLAVKDQSELQLFRLSLQDAKYGIAAYQKKAEYGPARLVLARLGMEQVGIPRLLETGSLLILDDQEIEGNLSPDSLQGLPFFK
jgi:hypothetical protein